MSRREFPKVTAYITIVSFNVYVFLDQLLL